MVGKSSLFYGRNNSDKIKMSIYCLLIQFSLVNLIHMVAYPKGFTDDPYVDDEKFIEKGKMLFYTILNCCQN